MQRPIKWFIGASFLILQLHGYGQKIEVSDPGIELRGNVIHVSYYIYNSTPSDEYTVELRVNDSQGKVIPAKALSGDVGETVKGGGEKHIAWDLASDGIVMNADISFQLYVKAVPPPEPEVVVNPAAKEVTKEIKPDEKTAEDQPVDLQAEASGRNNPAGDTLKETVKAKEDLQAAAEKTKPEPDRESSLNTEEPASESKEFKRAGLMLQSAVLPGLGLTRYRGGPHWIKGVGAYGCLAGSVVLNRMAISNYSKLETLPDYDSKNDLYHTLYKQDMVSEILAYAAIGIWVTDLVWTFFGTSDINRTASHDKGLRINSKIDPVSRAPLIAFTYKF